MKGNSPSRPIVIYGIVALTLISMIYLVTEQVFSSSAIQGEKIKGVSLVAPPQPFQQDPFAAIQNINANAVAIMPYAFSVPGNGEVIYNHPRQWWGERKEGTIETIVKAKEAGMKILLKPHLWVKGQGWTGEFEQPNDSLWSSWFQSYTQYVIEYALLADSLEVGMFCVGLEFKKVVEQNPDFFKELIRKVRKVYKGRVIYAANWDNYQNVTFWEEVDMIGINTYFPLSQNKDPEVSELKEAWLPIAEDLKSLSEKYQKPILISEFGYRSMDGAAGNQWELPDNWRYEGNANLGIQANAYRAFFESLWLKDWCAGGFVWKWYAHHEASGGPNNNDYTPQNKPAQKVIERWYGPQP